MRINHYPIIPYSLAVILCCFFLQIHAQNKKADSIFRILSNHKQEDTIKAKLMFEYAAACYPITSDSTFKYSELGYRLSQKLQFRFGIMRGLNNIGLKFWTKNQLENAITPYRQALAIAVEIGNIESQAKISNNIGILHQSTGLLDSASIYLLRSLDFARQIGDEKLQAKSFADLGTLYGLKGDYLQSVKYLTKSLVFYENVHSIENQVIIHIRLGNQYLKMEDFKNSRKEFVLAQTLNDSVKNKRWKLDINANLGLLYCQVKKDPDSALLFLLQAEKIAIEMNATEVILTISVNMGSIYYQEKNYQKALEYFLKAYSNPLINGRRYEKTATLVNLGTVYMNLGEYRKSKKFLAEGLQLASESQYAEFRKIAFEALSTLAEKQHDFRSAFEYLQKVAQLNDSIWRENLNQQVAKVDFQYQLEKKETMNKSLIKENQLKTQIIIKQRLIVYGSVFILLLVSALLLIILKNRNKLKHAENGLRKLNTTLEERVAERTHQLETINRELLFKNKELEQFTFIASHDLAEPLNALTNFTQLLHNEYSGKLDEDGNASIDFIYHSAIRMKLLLKGLLDYSLLGKDSVVSAVDCNKIVSEVLSDLKDSIEGSKAKIAVQTLPVISGYPSELRFLFHHLINNAIKFRKKDVSPEINISVESTENERVFSIEDNGIGLKEQDKEKVFVIFKRMVKRDEYEGTGIGLAQCKKIVELHGGRIWVESEPGVGSRFIFTIPVDKCV
jgi:signal transduction histidine kinase